MIAVREIGPPGSAADRRALAQARRILGERFGGLDPAELAGLEGRLSDPLAQRLAWRLLAAVDGRGRVRGAALLAHAPDLGFVWLDLLAADRRLAGGGTGDMLYQEVRRLAKGLDAVGVFLECLPDEPALCRDPALLRQNRARLRFYERFGARPVEGTAYETPLEPGGDCPPLLVFDGLGRGRPLGRHTARAVVRAVLERRYGHKCPPGYIAKVVASFGDDPVRLRPPRYTKPVAGPLMGPRGRDAQRIALVVTDRHAIHHVRERGYVEAPARVGAILAAIEPLGVFKRLAPRRHGLEAIEAVHDKRFVAYLRRMCTALEPGRAVYPYVFPLRNAARPPRELWVRAGYWCIDTFTPLSANAYAAARRAVDCALTAAEAVAAGRRLAYALVRPPGHHAERRAFGGFCYFNAAAIAAQRLAELGAGAVVDLDFHHGNGTQDIFYERADVLTVSIHGHPSFAYPYFSGFAGERGAGAGLGANLNLPLGEGADGRAHRAALAEALARVRRHKAQWLVIALGLDTAKGDPTGAWRLEPADFAEMGRLVGALGLPTLVVQEGGYRIRGLGLSAQGFFAGLWRGARGQAEAAS